MASKDASRAKENLHLDTYFTSRSGFEAFTKRYFKRYAFWLEKIRSGEPMTPRKSGSGGRWGGKKGG